MVGMHEKFHDTLNFAKRKPRRLAGTPAAKYSFRISLGLAALATYIAFMYKEFNFTRSSKERLLLFSLPDEKLRRQKLLFEDPCLRSALLNYEQRQMKLVDPIKQSDYSSAGETSDSEQSFDSSEHLSFKENSSITNLVDNTTKNNKRPGSPIEDDSLADFKLPKLNSRSNLARNGVKLLDNPKKPTRVKSNPSRNVKKKAESNQMSIESSFFKPSTAFVCPLCLKSFNESSQQIAHSKNCAVKNKISTRQLIAATELHERQAEERKAIGLPAAPIQQAKKTPKFKRMSTDNDPDVELAIALSKSLSEAQEVESFEEAVVLAAESNEKILEMSSAQRKSTLVNFGFITNKPIISDFTEKPKKKKIGLTILQTRTEEVRSRLLAEKIAEAIVDNVIATQEPVSPKSVEKKYEDKKINFTSMILKEIYRQDCKLWNGSVGEENTEFYYIKTLCKFIKPIEKINFLKSEDKLYINKIADDRKNEIKNIDHSDCTSSINENVSIVANIGKNQDSTFNSFNSDQDLIKNDQTIQNISVDSENREEKDENKSERSLKEDRLKGLNPLGLSWSKIINSKIHSDVIIYVKHKKSIFSHFLVLWIRCREIEKDLIASNIDNNSSNNGTGTSDKRQQWIIVWEDIEYEAAILFLEFIYCGTIINLEALKDRLILYNVKNLAQKYKIEELDLFLEKLEVQIEILSTDCKAIKKKDKNKEYSNLKKHDYQNFSMEEDENEIAKINENSNIDPQLKSSEFFAQLKDDDGINIQKRNESSINTMNVDGSCTKNSETTVIIISEDELELPEIRKSATKRCKNESLRASFMSASPDIFDGMETINLGNPFGRKYQYNKDSDNCTIEHYLENDHKLPISTELFSKIKEEIDEHEKEVIKKKNLQTNKEKYLDDSTPTEEENLGKDELNIENNYSKNDNFFETSNQLTEKNNECETVTNNIASTRNNLSLFIEKIQRRNARFLESDTDEDDSVIMNVRKKKNPFKIGRLSDNDSGLLNKFRQKDLMNQKKENIETKKKSALSIFEDDIRNRVAIEIQKKGENERDLIKNTQDDAFQENFSDCNSDIEFVNEHWSGIQNTETDAKSDLQQVKEMELKVDLKSISEFDNILANDSSIQSGETSNDEVNESMYTKYKKTHRRNSIDKYRALLEDHFNNKSRRVRKMFAEEENNSESSEDYSENVENTEESSPQNSFQVAESPRKDQVNHNEKTHELRKNKRISLINQKNLTELSSFDFYEIEDIPEEGHREDDENLTQNFQKVLNRSVDLTIASDEEENIEIHEQISDHESNLKEVNNKNNLIDREMHGENFNSMDWTEVADVNFSSNQKNPSDRNTIQPEDKDFSLVVESNWEPHSPKVNWKIKRSSNESFTQFTGTPTVTENITKILQECGVLSSSYQSKEKSRISIADILSPIVLSSATNSDDENGIDNLPENLFLNFDGEVENNNDNYSQSDGEVNFTRFEYEGGVNNELSDLRLSTHLPIKSSTQYLKTPPASPRSSILPKRLIHDISSDEETKSSRSKRCSSISPLKNKSQRLLQVKSQSEGNFSNSRKSLKVVQSDGKTKYSKRKQNHQKNEEICEYLGLSPSKVDISLDVSPKESYDQLSSPELKKRLASFGLKNQERRRAVKLLNFIWDQMHPLVPEILISNDARNNHSNITGNKNTNSDKTRRDSLQQINEKDSSEDDSKDKKNPLHKTGFPEELEFSDDDDDDDDDDNNDNSHKDENHLIKQLQQNFEKLLQKDCILHRKILMYESISLDIFVEKLKECGFQVKPKILTDFLNSECISFFIEAPKKWSGNIRKNKRK